MSKKSYLCNYSITDVPLSDMDMRQLTEAVDLLKQMSSFKGFDDVEDVVNRLEGPSCLNALQGGACNTVGEQRPPARTGSHHTAARRHRRKEADDHHLPILPLA